MAEPFRKFIAYEFSQIFAFRLLPFPQILIYFSVCFDSVSFFFFTVSSVLFCWRTKENKIGYRLPMHFLFCSASWTFPHFLWFWWCAFSLFQCHSHSTNSFLFERIHKRRIQWPNTIITRKRSAEGRQRQQQQKSKMSRKCAQFVSV